MTGLVVGKLDDVAAARYPSRETRKATPTRSQKNVEHDRAGREPARLRPIGHAAPGRRGHSRIPGSLGVPSGQIPATIETQAGLLRSMMASRSVLIVADNARDADQVRPLLPGNRACLVLVTSRCQLIGLVAAYGATPIGLGLLTRAEALQLLGHRLGGHRLADETCAAEELITGCAGLPLALTVAAARATARLG